MQPQVRSGSEADLIRAHAAADAALRLKRQGFEPDLIIGIVGSVPEAAMAQMEKIAPVVLLTGADASRPIELLKENFNTTAKLLMLTHAFETLGCQVVGWRTDNFNFASQAAIERLGAKKDGVIRGHALRRDGTVRDTVMYSMRRGEWPEAKAQLLYLLDKQRA